MADLLIVTLGPIQDFIAAARRSRDLWFGSWLLSELAKASARAMAEECGLDALVFPGVAAARELAPGSAASVANKIVLRVPDGKDPAAVAERGERAMRDRLRDLRDEAFRWISGPAFDAGKAREQVDDLIEYAWVSAPERGEHGYRSARTAAEALMTARKSTRLWGKVPWGAPVPKSSIDGERESVLHENLFDGVTKGELTPQQVRGQYGVGPTERLCGVGLLKRHGTREGSRYAHRFLSTGHLAAWPLHRRAKGSDDPELQAAWKRYLEVLEMGGINLPEQEIVQANGWKHESLFGLYDGSLLFEGRLPELFEEVNDPERRQSGLRDAKAALACVLKKLGVSTPLPYYAILVADGDHMGKAIERQDSFPAHQALSRQLDRFAQSVRTTVEADHAGELIYAGGDDVLAFVPLHRAVACARDLQRGFGQMLAGFPVDDQTRATPTLSAGIGISHFMDPLRGALRLARKAEKLAKEKRNSLAIIVDKRSGPPIEVAGIWGTLDLRLEDYIAMHRADEVPDGAAYELRELARLLEGAKNQERQPLSELVKKEAKRILRRKQPGHGAKKKLDPAVFGRLEEDIDSFAVGDVADRLIVARLLAQAQEESGEPLTPLLLSTAGGQP